MSKLINVTKTFFAFILFGFCLSFCKKNDHPGNNPGGGLIDYHQTAVTQFIAVGETNIAYRVLGKSNGTPLVMIASLGSAMDDWDPAVTNGLAQKYRVILFDIQGVGSSGGSTPENIADMANGTVDFIKALGYKKVNLLGFSMGSFISEQIVLTNPGLVYKIILTGTGPKGAEGLSNLPNLLQSTAGLTPEQFFLTSHFAPSATSQAAGKLAFERIQKRTENRDPSISGPSITNELKSVLGWAQPYPDALNELKNIKKPVLIVQGENDLLVPVINARRMAETISGAQLIVYPDAGHGAFYQYHDEFVKAAVNFLK